MLALSALIIGSLGLLLGALALIKSQAIESSTHTIQYMPIDTAIDQENEAFLKKQKEMKGEWATSDSTIKEQMKLYEEEVSRTMPEFSVSDEDKDVISF